MCCHTLADLQEPVMVNLSAEEQRQVEAGALAFVEEFRKTAPESLTMGAAPSGSVSPADVAFLQQYTDSLGQLATTRFSDSLQVLLEEEPELSSGFLQSADSGSSIGHFVLNAFQKRLCNPVAEADLKTEIARIRQDHKLEINPTATGISGGAATAAAVVVGTLIGSGPLATVLAPLAGSVALLLLLVGMDTFCSWAASKQG
jgi:hypothetical protein